MMHRSILTPPARLYRFSIAACAITLSLAASPAFAQEGALVGSSLDETAHITSRGGRAPGPTGGPIALPYDFTKMKLETGNVLQMSVFDAPEMTQRLAVDDAGNVDVPLAGPVHVEGDSIREAEQKIANALVARHMMNAPQVSLEVTAFSPRSIVVAGEVQQPGKIQMLAPRPLLEVIASVGGVTTAAGGDIEIHRPRPDGQEDVQHVPYANGKEPTEAQAAIVNPGDSVFVRRAGVIYVLGAVVRPGGYLMVNGGKLSLAQAIASASGTTPVAAPAATIIVRKSGNGLIQLQPRLDKVERGLMAPLPLQDGDMVYVPTSKLKSALINSSVVLSSAASAVIYAGINH
jgi:polysaccharide export outer membrane protein